MLYQQKYHDKELAKLNVLITGGAGFIGSHIVEYLIKYGIGKVRVLDNLSTGYRKNIEPFLNCTNFEFLDGDIRSLEDCLQACDGMDIICHQAALGSVPRSVKEPHLTTAHNILGFVNMVHAATIHGIKRFIYASSSSVFGDEPNLPKIEARIGKPLSPYAISKYTNELFAENFAALYGMEFIGFRYFNVFGPRQSPEGAYAAVIPLFCNACINNQELFINGDGEQTRDFTFVENVVQINIKAMFTSNQGALNQVYNVGCGGRYSINELLKGVKKAAQKLDKKAIHRAARAGDIRDSQADITKASQYLEYDPTFNFYEGLKLTVEYFIKIS